jgi:hypothetical protein
VRPRAETARARAPGSRVTNVHSPLLFRHPRAEGARRQARRASPRLPSRRVSRRRAFLPIPRASRPPRVENDTPRAISRAPPLAPPD